MVRTIFLFLVALNLIVLAWIYFTGDAHVNAGREPQRMKAALAADKIHIVFAGDAAILAGTPAPAAVICRAFSGATITEAQQIAKLWTANFPAAIVVTNPVIPHPVFGIAIAGFTTRTAAESRLAELKKLGLTDNAKIRSDDNNRFLLLVGSFTERSMADDARKVLVSKGVRSVAIVERRRVPEQSTIEVRGTDAELKKLLEQASANNTLAPSACAAP